jgi:hypothetical protein
LFRCVNVYQKIKIIMSSNIKNGLFSRLLRKAYLMNIRVKNIFQILKSAFIDGKEFIFKPNEERLVPDSFLATNGQPKFPFLKVTGFERQEGQIFGVYKHDKIQNAKPNNIYKTQKYVYEFENEITGKKIITGRVAEAAKEMGCTSFQNIILRIKNGKDKYKEWKMKRYTIDEYRKINPKFFEDNSENKTEG